MHLGIKAYHTWIDSLKKIVGGISNKSASYNWQGLRSGEIGFFGSAWYFFAKKLIFYFFSVAAEIVAW